MRLLRLTLLWIVALLVVGCGGPPKKSGLMKTTAGSNITISAEQLRIQVRALVDPFSGRIEEAADEIIAGSDDPRIRLAALEWKANAIPALREALFRPDQLGAVMDAWALAKQMEDYFETGDGRERLGPWADVALAASRDLERDFEAFLASASASGDISTGREFIDRWAVEHPIRGSVAGRQSILNEVDDVKIKGGMGGFRTLSGVGVGMDDLSRRMEVYSAQLPKIATWQAEIMLLKMLGDEASDPPLAALPRLMETAVDLGATVEDLPDLVAAEREAILEAVRVERLETLEFIRAERKAILAWASAERTAILAEFDAQRQAATVDMQGELQQAIETLQGEREQTLDDAEQIGTRTIDYSIERVEGLIDHVFMRSMQLLGIALVGVLLLLFVARLLLRGKTA
jgi:hypothetical protein